ncbi:MAG TPA: peptide-methionine (S)-S-oxide reductase MsrA [Thermoanaerobaculia bacterium]|nr:peptide-methionine (S)-S-oxide reductase MsrA [Thermoanaerobaculia bacterium]
MRALPKLPRLLVVVVLVAAGLFLVAWAAATAQTERAEPPPAGLAVATFAGGCFWCMEPPFDALEGVKSTTSGYIGGSKDSPSYREVTSGRTGHTEALRVVYDAQEITYQELLDVYWRNVDPLQDDRQFCDVGSQYRPAIFVHDDEQRRLAEASKKRLDESGRFQHPIVVEIEDAGDFWVAEEYHQDYYEKNPVRYKVYSTGCGRERRLEQLWGRDSD